MTNHEMKKPGAANNPGQAPAVTATDALGDSVDPLAGLSAAHLEACRKAARVDTLINLTLAYLLAQREKRK
jgi:hypothetical protein